MERMTTSADQDVRHWLLIDASRPGEIALTAVQPAAAPRVGRAVCYPAAGLPTFTDALLRFERETGTALNRSTAVLTIAGAVSGKTIALARSRWTISRAGLASLFGRPAVIINEVAAKAWATLADPPKERPIRGAGFADFAGAGRYSLLSISEGVGAAIIDVDEAGVARVLDTEAGHTGFAPDDEADDRLTAALRRSGRAVSWERVLTLSPDDPAWTAAAPGEGRAERMLRLARLTGSFMGDLTLGHGAWSGAMLTGRRIGTDAASKAAFDGGFMGRRQFRRMLTETPCWQLDQQDSVLRGAAALLGRRHAEQTPLRIAA